MYSIEFTTSSEKQLHKLPKDIQIRIVHALDKIRTRPFDHVTKLVGYEAYRLRVGDYRLILEIKGNKLIILVIKIGHRKNIYNF